MENLKIIRKIKGITQQQLGEMTSISRKSIIKIEAKILDPTISMVKDLSLALGVPLKDIIGDDYDFVTSPEKEALRKAILMQIRNNRIWVTNESKTLTISVVAIGIVKETEKKYNIIGTMDGTDYSGELLGNFESLVDAQECMERFNNSIRKGEAIFQIKE